MAPLSRIIVVSDLLAEAVLYSAVHRSHVIGCNLCYVGGFHTPRLGIISRGPDESRAITVIARIHLLLFAHLPRISLKVALLVKKDVKPQDLLRELVCLSNTSNKAYNE